MKTNYSRRVGWMAAGVLALAGMAAGQGTTSTTAAPTPTPAPTPAPAPTPTPTPAPAPTYPTTFRPAPPSPIQGVPAGSPGIRSYGDGAWRTRLKSPPPRSGDVFVPRPVVRPVGDNTYNGLVRPIRDGSSGDGYVPTGSTTTINGGAITTDYQAGIRAGIRAGYLYNRHRHSYGYGYGGWYWPGNWTSYDTVGPERVFTPDPKLLAPSGQPAAQPTQQHELTLVELAEYSLSIGDAVRAADQLEAHLASEPDDSGAKRLLGVALLEQRKVEQAVAVLVQAYMDQPMLARTPIETEILAGGEMTHRARFTRLMDFANRTKTASAYFAACVLAQSEGRADVAKKLLKKAADAGLSKGVVDEMRLALAKG